jgi:GxxExxY protein
MYLTQSAQGETLDKQFVIDSLVEDEVIIEYKSVEAILPVHEAQVVTYLKLANKKLGLLINFNVVLLKEGIRRKINGNLNSA